MKIRIQTGYRADMADLAEGLNDLMADLEDVREDALEHLEGHDSDEGRGDIRRMEKKKKKLGEAADLLELEEE